MSETSNQQFTCEWCGATKAKRTGDSFDSLGLSQHRLRCRKRPSATVVPTVAITPIADPTNGDGGKPIESRSPTVADASSLSPPLGGGQEGEKQQPSSAAAVDEERESDRALWSKNKYCREWKGTGQDRRLVRAFNNKEVGMMTAYLKKGWRHLNENERASYQGLVAMLHSHVEQEDFEDKETPMEQKAKDDQKKLIAKEDADKQRRIEVGGEWWLALSPEEKEAHDKQFWDETQRATRELPEPEGPVEPDPFFPPKREPGAPMVRRPPKITDKPIITRRGMR